MRPERLSNDIGQFVQATMSVSEVTNCIKNLSDAQKLIYLDEHIAIPSNYTFPSVYLNGCNRSFKYSWLEKYPYLVYSPSLDAVFCKYCVLFSHERSVKAALVNLPFTNWTRCSDAFRDHSCSKLHTDAVHKSNVFKESLENSTQIPVVLDAQIQQLVAQNRTILKYIVDAIIFCGKQCIALRGDSENINDPGNCGNFLEILKLLSKENDLLSKHLSNPNNKNATYVSPDIQNQLISVIGFDIIQADILKEISNAKFFSVLADEVTSHNQEHLSLCIRFVDSNNKVREEFLEFVRVIRTSGEALAIAILSTLQTMGLSVHNIRGQGYDGAAAMSSEKVGVQGRIIQEEPKAVYTHCSSHNLNLVIAHSCSLPNVRNMLDILKEASLFFSMSPKRQSLLNDIVSKCSEKFAESENRKVLLDICKTRWAERHKSYQHFYQAFPYIVKCLEVIAFGLHGNEGLDPQLVEDGKWDREAKTRATSLLNSICDFGFLITFITVYKLLSRLEGVTVLLQREANDIISAVDMIEELKMEFRAVRGSIEQYFNGVFQHAVRLGESVGTEPSMPRIVKRQIHRSNTEATSPEQYYLRNMAIPFVDHLCNELESQFSMLNKTASKLLYLVPSVMKDKNPKFEDVEEAFDFYRGDLPSPEVFQEEYNAWKFKWYNTLITPEDIPRNCSSALQACNKHLYPNIFTLLKIACVIPVTSCVCERSFSAMRRLNNYMRCTMGQQRLSSLALMHIHREKKIETDLVVKIFSAKHTRRLQFSSVLV